MDKVITCINCPVGCRMTVSLSAEQECTCPLRMLTAVIPVSGSDMPLSVKTSVPVPKDMIQDIMHTLAGVRVSLPVSAGDVILRDVLGTGSDIVATRELYSC